MGKAKRKYEGDLGREFYSNKHTFHRKTRRLVHRVLGAPDCREWDDEAMPAHRRGAELSER